LIQGSALNLVQDLPISKPLTAGEINSLSDQTCVPTLCGFYSDLKGVQPRLAAAVDRMKALGSTVHLALCKVGWQGGLLGRYRHRQQVLQVGMHICVRSAQQARGGLTAELFPRGRM
jgi:hypothetical protein